MDAKTGGDQAKEFRRQVRDLTERVHRLEAGLFRAVVAVGVGAIVLGYFIPFLTATEKARANEGESIALLPAIFGLGQAGGGPFRGEAMLATVVVSVFAMVTVVALVALLRLFGGEVAGRRVRFARVCGIVLLVLCGIGWLLVFAMAGHFDGRVSAFSPATLTFTIGGLATLAADVLHPTDWRD
ncbi:hypothetical protein [Actinophytocola sediminis]